MYAKNIISLYKILKKEPKTVDEVKDHEKGIKELKKLIDRYVKRHRNSNEMKKIKVIFSNYNKPEALIGEVFGFRFNKPICGEKVENGIEILFDIFKNKGSKKFSQAIKDKLVGLTLSEEKVENIFKAFDALFGVISFSKSDMLKSIDVISELVDQEKDDLEIVLKRISKNFNSKCETLQRLYSREVVYPYSSKISNKFDELSKITVSSLFIRRVEALWKYADPRQSTNKIPPNDELLKRLYGSVNDFFERIYFQTTTNTFCCEFNINLKEPFDIKIKKIYDKCKNAVANDIKNCEQQINEMVDEMEKTLLKKSGKKPESTRPLPTPPVRGKSSSDVPKKPLPIPNSEQRKDAVYSSDDESKKSGTSNDKSVKPKGSNDKSRKPKTRFSKLFGRKQKKDNNAPNDESNKSNTSDGKSRKSKNRFSKLFGRKQKEDNNAPNGASKKSKISSYTSGNSSNSSGAHQKELNDAIKRRSQRINPNEVPVKS